MQTISLAVALCLRMASCAVLRGPTATKHHRLEARTPAPGPASAAVSDTSIEYYTSTYLNIIPGQTNDAFTQAAQTITIAIPTCHQTIVPDHNGYVPPGTCNALWNYYPSFSAAAAFSALFIVLLLIHIWQAIAYRKVRESLTIVRHWDCVNSICHHRSGAGSSSQPVLGRQSPWYPGR